MICDLSPLGRHVVYGSACSRCRLCAWILEWEILDIPPAQRTLQQQAFGLPAYFLDMVPTPESLSLGRWNDERSGAGLRQSSVGDVSDSDCRLYGHGRPSTETEMMVLNHYFSGQRGAGV